jgi:hypothetical protein
MNQPLSSTYPCIHIEILLGLDVWRPNSLYRFRHRILLLAETDLWSLARNTVVGPPYLQLLPTIKIAI